MAGGVEDLVAGVGVGVVIVVILLVIVVVGVVVLIRSIRRVACGNINCYAKKYLRILIGLREGVTLDHGGGLILHGCNNCQSE